jgi:hypothetical protein
MVGRDAKERGGGPLMRGPRGDAGKRVVGEAGWVLQVQPVRKNQISDFLLIFYKSTEKTLTRENS